jgi:hypothetical protein
MLLKQKDFVDYPKSETRYYTRHIDLLPSDNGSYFGKQNFDTNYPGRKSHLAFEHSIKQGLLRNPH